jgi:hypothetical protein
MGGTTFGVGLPSTYPTSQLNPFALSTYGTQASGSYPSWGQQQQQYVEPLQQILQVLQIVPQQLQHLQQLEYVQQQQLQQLQQILQVIPAQLAQLQQLTQFVPQQIHQMQPPSQAQQPFGQGPGLGGFAATTPQWGISPQVFGSQPGHVM